MEDFVQLGNVAAESKLVVILLLCGVVGMLWRQLLAVQAQRDKYIEKFIEVSTQMTAALNQFTNALELLTKEVERNEVRTR